MTPLQFACQSGNLKSVNLLLNQKNIEVNKLSGDYKMPAICYGCKYIEIIKVLCKRQDIDLSIVFDNTTIFQYACMQKCEESAIFLLETGKFDISKPFKNGVFLFYFIIQFILHLKMGYLN